MKEVIRTNDPVLLAFVQVILTESGIETLLFDQQSSVLAGSIGAIQQRIMVRDADYARTRTLLTAEGLADELRYEEALF